MNLMTFGKGALIFVAMIITFCVNADDGIISRLGIEFTFGLVASTSLLVSLLLIRQTTLIVGSVITLSLVANMPLGFVLNFGLDRDLYLGVAAAMICLPFASRVLD
jgi:hypothetical protein